MYMLYISLFNPKGNVTEYKASDCTYENHLNQCIYAIINHILSVLCA